MRVFDRLSSPRVLAGIVNQSFYGIVCVSSESDYGRSAGERRCSDGLGSQPEPKGRAVQAKRRGSRSPTIFGSPNVTWLSLVQGRAAFKPTLAAPVTVNTLRIWERDP